MRVVARVEERENYEKRNREISSPKNMRNEGLDSCEDRALDPEVQRRREVEREHERDKHLAARDGKRRRLPDARDDGDEVAAAVLEDHVGHVLRVIKQKRPTRQQHNGLELLGAFSLLTAFREERRSLFRILIVV